MKLSKQQVELIERLIDEKVYLSNDHYMDSYNKSITEEEIEDIKQELIKE